MSIAPGMHRLGPENATLTVETKRLGAASKVGHDLVIEVTSWEAELDVDGDPAVTLTADGGSLRVREGTGGMTKLGDEEKAGIEQTIDEEVLRRRSVEFRSSAFEVSSDGSGATVSGELDLMGTSHPVSFELRTGDGRLTGRATLRQSDWGIKPYSALFGTLKVADAVEIAIDASLPQS